jgi:ATP-binding cassette, subfamily B, bacterial PglK
MNKYLNEILTLLGSDKKRLPGMVFLFFLVSLLDVLGIGLIGPYISTITDPQVITEYSSNIEKWIGLSVPSKDLLVYMSLLLLVVFVSKAISSVWINYVIARFSADQQIRLRTILMKSYQSLPYVEYIERNSSEYIHNIQTLVQQYANTVIFLSLKSVSDIIVAFTILVLLAWVNLSALLLLFSLIVLTVLVYNHFFKEKMKTMGRLSNKSSDNMVQAIYEGIEGLKEVRVLGCERHFYNKVKKNSTLYGSYYAKSTAISTAPRYMLETTLMIFILMLVIVSLYVNNDLSQLLPTLGIFGIASIRLLPAANNIASTMMHLQFNRDAISRLYRDVIECESRVDNVQGAGISTNNNNVGFEQLKLDGISYQYPSSNHKALSDISLTIKSGETIGFIGTSGSGKTTLIDLLLGLLKPQQGMVIYNKKLLEDSYSTWRKHVAYLPQQIFLIDDTLKANIALGVNDCDINEEKLNTSLRMAQLSELIEQLAEGVNTIIGERGIKLSGGQKQRISLARAFYHERDVLVMDESTSALDEDTEREIVNEIQKLKGSKTLIIIAHRLSTLHHCDRIYRLEKGRIMDFGTAKKMLNLR